MRTEGADTRRRVRARTLLTSLRARRRAEELAEEMRTVNERLVVAAVRMQELSDEAERALRARDDLLAVVSHDLRTPLAAISMSAAILSKKCAPAGTGSPVERIARSAEHMRSLLQDLVDGAKIDAGRFVVDRRPHAVAPVVADVLEMMTPLAARKTLCVERAFADALGDRVAWLDRQRMVQVLTNLLGNAIKFTPAGGSITVGAGRLPDEVTLSIRDTGPGMPPEDLPRIFDRFWQARRTARLGIGLGLFIAKAIVEAHCGRIWAESEVGAGSTFFVALPLGEPGLVTPAATTGAGA